MKLLVTGHHGQLAQSLIAAARAPAAGIEIVALGRPEFDLARLETLAIAIEAHAPDLVVNAAAYTAVDRAETDADAALLINGAAAGAIAEACARQTIPIVQVSTDFVFDGRAEAPYRETDLTSPINVYGASKLLGEQLVAASTRRHLILRTSWVISPFGHNFVKTMLRLGTERPKLAVVDDQHGAPTSAMHLAEAIFALAQAMATAPAEDPRWGLYHVTNSGVTTWCGLAREIFAVAGRYGAAVPEIAAIPASAYPTPARRPANSRLDGSKLVTTFGITLPPWQDGVRATVEQLMTETAAQKERSS